MAHRRKMRSREGERRRRPRIDEVRKMRWRQGEMCSAGGGRAEWRIRTRSSTPLVASLHLSAEVGGAEQGTSQAACSSSTSGGHPSVAHAPPRWLVLVSVSQVSEDVTPWVRGYISRRRVQHKCREAELAVVRTPLLRSYVVDAAELPADQP